MDAELVIRGGTVVDFMNLGVGTLRTGIFNVADVAIVVGAVLVMSVRERSRPGPPGCSRCAGAGTRRAGSA